MLPQYHFIIPTNQLIPYTMQCHQVYTIYVYHEILNWYFNAMPNCCLLQIWVALYRLRKRHRKRHHKITQPFSSTKMKRKPLRVMAAGPYYLCHAAMTFMQTKLLHAKDHGELVISCWKRPRERMYPYG